MKTKGKENELKLPEEEGAIPKKKTRSGGAACQIKWSGERNRFEPLHSKSNGHKNRVREYHKSLKWDIAFPISITHAIIKLVLSQLAQVYGSDDLGVYA